MIGSASAPASSANLGPGFDTLGLALELRCRATVERSDSMTLTEHGSTKRLPDANLVAQAVDLAVGCPMHVTLSSEIPRARGLGSSAAVAASVAGAALKAVGSDDGPARVYQIVTELEGHADNAAATVFGGLVAVADGGVRRLDLHPSLLVVAAVPHEPLRTDQARAALPDSVSFAAAARSLSRLAFLIEGLSDANIEVLSHASGDELHEGPRGPLSPVTGELMEAAMRAGAVHACWSGAGPTALAFTFEGNRGRVIGAMGGVLGSSGEVLALNVDYDGLL